MSGHISGLRCVGGPLNGTRVPWNGEPSRRVPLHKSLQWSDHDYLPAIGDTPVNEVIYTVRFLVTPDGRVAFCAPSDVTDYQALRNLFTPVL